MVEKDRVELNAIFSKRVPIAIETPAKDIDLLINFARYYATLILQNRLWQNVHIEGGVWPENAVSSVYYTLSTIIQSSHIQLYLKHISFGPRIVLGGQSSIDTAMIVMADADLYSVIGTLTSERVGKRDYLDRPLWYLKKIWIQEPIKDKFVDLIDELQIKDDTSSIKSMLHAFRNRDEVLQNLGKEIHVKAFSIWSSNVVTAKNMASSAERVFLVWINSYGEIGPSVSLPWADVVHHNNIKPIEHEINLISRIDGKKTVDLFYDGAWQEPINELYWEDERKVLWASATWTDVEKCVASAENGFKKWRYFPSSKRQKCFYRLASRIQSNGDSALSRSIRVWAESPVLYGSSSSRIQDESVEIVTTREPRGVIAIACDNREELFRRIVYACVAGNSIIVVNNRVGHATAISGIEEYCDTLATCGFPPGVLNSLSFYDLPNAIEHLSKIRCIAVACTDFFTPTITGLPSYWADTRRSTDEILYAKYTRPKSVWLPLQ
ncbi:uncharacterized protein [Venturia canescens]|nr:uncharacterized protein LOC122415149 isoform X2 [Venturia canescens]